MSKWQEKTKRPVLPVYMAALVWPIMALLVPIYTLGGLVLTAAVSAGAYFAGTKLCPTRVVRTYVPYATGSEDVDAMLNGIAANLDALHKLNEAIPDPQLSRAMDRMEKAGRSIAAVVEKTPDKARSVDRFARYYLPEVVKLMGTYAALEQNGVRGENAAQIEAELRRNAETTATAFENQLDALYSAEAMDISTDIEVLDSILNGETFTFANAASMRRAAVCCFVISGAALVRTVWGLAYYCSVLPLLSYNFLFVPVFLMAGLVCMVMSALFRQAAELKAENDLTI